MSQLFQYIFSLEYKVVIFIVFTRSFDLPKKEEYRQMGFLAIKWAFVNINTTH